MSTPWSDLKFKPLAMCAFPPSSLPKTAAGRAEFIHHLMNYPVVNEETGETEYVEMISKELAAKLLEPWS